MAIEWAKDLIDGSSYTLGKLSTLDTKAVLVLHVKGLTDNLTDLKNAADAAVAEHENFHPHDTNLPLRTVRAEVVGPNDAIVRMTYGRERGRRGNKAYQGTNIANMEVYWHLFTSWSNGAFSGTVATLNEVRQTDGAGNYRVVEAPRKVEIPLMVIEIPLENGASQLSSGIYGMIGKDNSNEYEMGGKTFGTHTLRFDGLAQSVEANSTTSFKYYSTLKYVHRADGWYEEFPFLTAANAKKAGRRFIYESATFVDPPLG